MIGGYGAAVNFGYGGSNAGYGGIVNGGVAQTGSYGGGVVNAGFGGGLVKLLDVWQCVATHFCGQLLPPSLLHSERVSGWLDSVRSLARMQCCCSIRTYKFQVEMPSRSVWLTIKDELEKVTEYTSRNQGNFDMPFYFDTLVNQGDEAVRMAAKFSELLQDWGDASSSDEASRLDVLLNRREV